MTAAYREILEGARDDLEAALGKHRCRLWFRDVAIEKVSGRSVTLAVPTDVHRTWLEYNYAALLAKAFGRVLGEGVEVLLRVSERLGGKRAIRDRLPADEGAWAALLGSRRPAPALLGYVAPDEPSRFIVSFLSQMVHGNSEATPAGLYLYGEPGSGKSHLLSALHRAIEAATPGASTLVTARQFTTRFVSALRSRETGAVRGFQAGLEGRRVLLIDGLDDLAGKPATQHELDGLLDRVSGRGLRLVAAGRSAPRELVGLSDRLRSRLLGGVVHRVSAPSRERLPELLSVRAAGFGVALPADVAHAIVARSAGVEAACRWLDRYAAVASQEVEAPGLDWLEEMAPPPASLSTREEIVRRAKDLVAKHFGVPLSILDRPNKHPSALLPRRVAMYLVYRAAALPLADLGRAFGLKSHTSASRAIREIRARRDDDPTVEVVVDGLLGQL